MRSHEELDWACSALVSNANSKQVPPLFSLTNNVQYSEVKYFVNFAHILCVPIAECGHDKQIGGNTRCKNALVAIELWSSLDSFTVQLREDLRIHF